MQQEICKWYDVCPMKRFYEEGKLDKEWINNYCFQGGKGCKRFEVVEGGGYCPDNLLPDGELDNSLE